MFYSLPFCLLLLTNAPFLALLLSTIGQIYGDEIEINCPLLLKKNRCLVYSALEVKLRNKMFVTDEDKIIFSSFELN